MRTIVILAALLLTVGLAAAQFGGMVPGPPLQAPMFGPMNPGGGGPMVPNVIQNSGPPPGCTPDGTTDWSNACNLPMGVALGVL